MTPHIKAKKEDFAETILMPGDPLRAKFIAENFLENAKEVNRVRGMLGFTGKYKHHYISVMGSGMGMPSMGIYSYELFKFYDVKNIIRIGSCGAFDPSLNLFDLILVKESISESSFAKVQNGFEGNRITPSPRLNRVIEETAKQINKKLIVTPILSSDVFYSEKPKNYLKDLGVSAVEMESFALFHNAKVLQKDAACILTVSDSIVLKTETSPDERETAFKDMMELALESSLKI